MTALTDNRERFVRGKTPIKGYGVAVDSDEFYEGGLVSYNGAGRIAPSSDTAGHRIAGVCTQRLTTGASNTLLVEFEFGHEEWFPHSAIVAADVGGNCVVVDDDTVTDAAAATNDVEVGRITQIESKRGTAGVWVAIAEFAVDNI